MYWVWFAPSLVEVEICVCSLLCEVELGDLYPSSVEVDCGCIASLEVVRLREEFGTPSGLEILHGGEGGDVELGARTSKHIFVFAFDPLSL